jgi:hypothetical protein
METRPEEFVCPITRELMRDPVLLQDGFSYEREAICAWFVHGRKSSPITNEPLSCAEIFPNRALKGAIDGFMARQRVALKATLLEGLGRVATNRELAHDDSLLRCCFVNVADGMLDTYHLLLAVLLSWKAEADVCTAALGALLRVVAHDGEGARRLAFLDFFPAVMDAMGRFDRSPAVQALGLRFVQAFCRLPPVFTASGSMHRLRAADAVLAAMRAHSLEREVQLEGAVAIQALGATFPSQVSSKAGVSRALFQAVNNFVDDAEVVLASCVAVTKLTVACCSRLCATGFCRKVAEAMALFSGHAQLQLQGCLVLGRLCHSKLHCDEATCDAVVACLQEHAEADAEIMLAGCQAVVRLAQWPRFAARVGRLGGCETAMGFLKMATEGGANHGEVADLAAAVAATLEVLSSEAESNNRERLATPAFRSGLVRLLRMYGGHRRAVLSCIKSMYNLSLFSTDYALQMEGEEGLSKLVIRAMRQHLADEEVQEYGWLCLDHLLPFLASPPPPPPLPPAGASA